MLPRIIVAFLSFLISNESSSYYIPSMAVGGNGGYSFDISRHYYGIVVTKLEVWQGVSMLRGIRITYSDGSTVYVGKLEDRYTSFELDYANGERVTELEVYPNYWNGDGLPSKDRRCGAFRIYTNHNHEFFPRMTGTRPLVWKHNISPGGGIILGLHGKMGDDIDSLGFTMIRPIRSMVLQNINYDMQHMPSPMRWSYYDRSIPNPSYEMSDEGFYQESTDIRRSGEWKISGSSTFGLDFTVSGSIPKIDALSGELTASWGISVEGSYRSSWSETIDGTVRVPLIAQALSITRIWYYFFTGTGIVTMNGEMRVTVDNGQTWTYDVSGTYDGVYESRIIGGSKRVAAYENGEWVYL